MRHRAICSLLALLTVVLQTSNALSAAAATVAADAMRTRLLDAGFAPADVQVLGPNERKGNCRCTRTS